MAARKEKTEVRQNEIAKAALAIIAARGLNDLSMAAIARRVGIVPSAIYRHFKGKDEVMDAILDFIQQRLSSNVRTAGRMEGNAIERIHLLLERHLKLFRDNESIPLVVLSTAFYDGNAQRLIKLMGIVDAYLAEVASLVEAGKQEGSIRRDVDAGAAAMMFIGIILPPTALWHIRSGKFDVQDHAEAAWILYRRSIEAKTDKPEAVRSATMRGSEKWSRSSRAR